MRTREISTALRKALLQGENMVLSLYQSKLAKHIDEWYEEMTEENGSFAFIVAEQLGEVALVMVDKDRNIYVNAEARAQLSKLWAKNYTKNVKFLIPKMAEHIDEYGFALTGITIQKSPKRSKAIGLGRKLI